MVNRLFFEQGPLDPQAVVPVFYRFPDKPMDQWAFALEYVENFMRHYVGFYTRQPEMILDKLSGNQLLIAIDQARSSYPFTRMLDVLLNWHDSIIKQDVVLPDSLAVEIPRKVSDIDDTSIVVFLDEFQNTRLPHHGFDIVGSMQEAVESPTCPHFVTESAMSILAREIIGRGSLFGRFDSKPIEPLSTYWSGELALRTTRYCEIDLPELVAPVVADRCGGKPFYINALIRQSAKLQTPLIDEEMLNDTLAVDLSSGFIWSELYEQVQGWIERLNEYNIN